MLARTGLLLLVSFICAQPIVQAGLITNGDFETGDFTGWNHWTDWTYGTSQFVSTSINATGGTQGPHCASLSFLLSGFSGQGNGVYVDASAGIGQDITVNVGDTLTFDYAEGSYGSIGSRTSYLIVGKNGAGGFSNSYTLSPMTTWNSYSFSFTEAGSYYIGITRNMSCASFMNSSGELLIDNVQLTSVPEPSTIVLLSIGAISLFGYARRQRRLE